MKTTCNRSGERSGMSCLQGTLVLVRGALRDELPPGDTGLEAGYP